MNAHDVIIRPVITEKNTVLMEDGKYTFEVALASNKIMIKAAVQELFNVKVKAVNTMIVKGKSKNRRTRQGVTSGRTTDWKKAIVTLVPGEQIDIFTDL